MIIRFATREDVPALVAMGLRFLASTSYSSFQTEATPARLEWMVGMCLEHGVGFVAEEESLGVLLGMIGFIVAPNELSGEKVATELAWWTNPEARGSSAGPRLIAVAEDWATRNGCVSIRMIAPNGTGLHTFYARRGYVPVETSFLKRLQDGGTHNDPGTHRPERSSGRGDSEEDRSEQGESRGG